MPKKYTGRERRLTKVDRRSVSDDMYHMGRSKTVPPEVSSLMAHGTDHADIMSLKEDFPDVERRHGAGRRAGDLKSALQTGRPVVYKLGKLAKKAGALGIAIGVIGAAKEAKAMGSTIGSSTAYKGSKNILPPKPRVR